MVSMGKGERKRRAQAALVADLARRGVSSYKAPVPTPAAPAPSTFTPSYPDHFDFQGLPIELRDMIYDEVALEEKTLGVQVTLDQGPEPQAHAYTTSALGRTCSTIREEYARRVQHRVKEVLKENDATRFSSDEPVMARVSSKRGIHIAERKTAKGSYVQTGEAWTAVIPVASRLDNGSRSSNLVITIASSSTAKYNKFFPIVDRADEKAWTKHQDDLDLDCAASDLHTLISSKDWKNCTQWRNLWEEYNEIFSRTNSVLPLREQKDFPPRFDHAWYYGRP